MRPTPRHIEISPQCGLYPMPSLCRCPWAALEWFRAFAIHSVSTCRPLRLREVRRLHIPSSFAVNAGLRQGVNDSALPTFPQSASRGGGHFGALLRFTCVTTCRVVCPPGGSDPASVLGQQIGR